MDKYCTWHVVVVWFGLVWLGCVTNDGNGLDCVEREGINKAVTSPCGLWTERADRNIYFDRDLMIGALVMRK